jgi:Ca2+-binding EF-hand superfamily protein
MNEKEIDDLLQEADLDADGQLNYTSMFIHMQDVILVLTMI